MRNKNVVIVLSRLLLYSSFLLCLGRDMVLIVVATPTRRLIVDDRAAGQSEEEKENKPKIQHILKLDDCISFSSFSISVAAAWSMSFGFSLLYFFCELCAQTILGYLKIQISWTCTLERFFSSYAEMDDRDTSGRLVKKRSSKYDRARE